MSFGSLQFVKSNAIKAIVATLLLFGLLGAFAVWFHPYGLALAWPGLALARCGLPHSWMLSVLVIAGGVVWLALWSRRHVWPVVMVANIIISFAYCGVAYMFPARIPVPLPAVTPYDTSPELRASYLEEYELAYRDYMLGNSLMSYCMHTEEETRGHKDGAQDGAAVLSRFFGWKLPEAKRKLMEN